MRNGLIGLVGAMALASAMATAACGDYGGNAGTTTGGKASAGNSAGGQSSGGTAPGGSATGGTGGAPTCTGSVCCGGDVVGTWNVTSSSLQLSGQVDLSLVGLNYCTYVPATGGSLQVSGTFKLNSDTTFEDTTTTTGDALFTMADECLTWSGARTTCDGLGRSAVPSVGFDNYPASNCVDATGGGCTCTGHVNHSGGMGVIAVSPLTSGNYTTSGYVLTVTDGLYTATYWYCVSGTTLTLTPQTPYPTTKGTIVLQKQ